MFPGTRRPFIAIKGPLSAERSLFSASLEADRAQQEVKSCEQCGLASWSSPSTEPCRVVYLTGTGVVILTASGIKACWLSSVVRVNRQVLFRFYYSSRSFQPLVSSHHHLSFRPFLPSLLLPANNTIQTLVECVVGGCPSRFRGFTSVKTRFSSPLFPAIVTQIVCRVGVEP